VKIDCLSIFPEIIAAALNYSIPKKAQDRGIVAIHQHNIRDFAHDKHHKVDDIPYGGGVGMVFKPGPTLEAIQSVKAEGALVIHPNPAAPVLRQKDILELSKAKHLIFVASRYEGMDQRVIDAVVDREYSLGDFVISGGELAVAVMIDAIVRLLPGALGKASSFEEDSFFNGLLDYPHYTRPPVFEEMEVPEVLQSGNHERIRKWRKREALRRTLIFRPDLLKSADLDKEAKQILRELSHDPTS
jgi:tRNA (guanine37-N1)-methyltransferase